MKLTNTSLFTGPKQRCSGQSTTNATEHSSCMQAITIAEATGDTKLFNNSDHVSWITAWNYFCHRKYSTDYVAKSKSCFTSLSETPATNAHQFWQPLCSSSTWQKTELNLGSTKLSFLAIDGNTVLCSHYKLPEQNNQFTTMSISLNQNHNYILLKQYQISLLFYFLYTYLIIPFLVLSFCLTTRHKF